MKQIIILCALMVAGCSSKTTEWDSGASRQESYQQERMEETTEEMRNQNTEPAEDLRHQNTEPVNTFRNQPF